MPCLFQALCIALVVSYAAVADAFGVATDPSVNTQQLRKNLNATDFKFDFTKVSVNNTPKTLGGGNQNAVWFSTTRPNIAGYGIAQTRVQLLPCGANTPHVHPRATELLYVISGNVTAGFVEENGNRVLTNTLTDYQSTFFPQGLIHWYQNTGCTTAEITAFFNWDDPGTTTPAVALTRLPVETLRVAFDIDATTAAAITANQNETVANNYFQHGTPECLAACGIN